MNLSASYYVDQPTRLRVLQHRRLGLVTSASLSTLLTPRTKTCRPSRQHNPLDHAPTLPALLPLPVIHLVLRPIAARLVIRVHEIPQGRPPRLDRPPQRQLDRPI